MIAIEGVGLHTGRPAVLRISPSRTTDACISIRWPNQTTSNLDTLIVDPDTERSTKLVTRDGDHGIQTVEHLFAAFAALSLQRGLSIEVDGPEIPLVDGCARTFFDQLASLNLPRRSSSRMEIVKAGTIEVGESTYELSPEGNTIAVTIDFNDSRLVPSASWTIGDTTDFRDRIAVARTFAFEHELTALLERGLANHVSRESVVVIGRESVHHAGRPFTWDEPARHKLLDLIGDLYAHGGPPLHGSIHARKPGHRATHRALDEAQIRGLIALR
jgi:UDP-3-O-[3-hydroxymyristoyl] N-acetylglucosamine deacetylase